MQHNKDGANLQQNKDDDYDGYLSNTINYDEYMFKTTKRMITSTIKKKKKDDNYICLPKCQKH